jgi:site-specific recombinase XerD
MREDLVRRNYAESTIRSYLHTIEDFRRYAQKRLDHLGPDDIRRYQVYLREERKLDIGTASNYVAALRFFYVKTLKRPSVREDLPYPLGVKRKRRLPTILSQEEVGRLIDSSKNLFHYAMLLTMYSTGLRRNELCRLKVANIDTSA